MATDLAKVAKTKGIEYFLISFVDLFGVLRAKLVPARAISEMQEEGAGFAGFAAWLDMSPADSDMFAVPDPDSLIQLPWKPNVGWLAADLYMDGAEVAQAPRNTLKRVVKAAEAKGYRMKHGVECEYILITTDGTGISGIRKRRDGICVQIDSVDNNLLHFCECFTDIQETAIRGKIYVCQLCSDLDRW